MLNKQVHAVLMTLVSSLFLFIFAMDYLKAPKTQGDGRAFEIYAKGLVGNSGNEQVMFEPAKGERYRIHCVYAESVCRYASANPDRRLTVQLMKVSTLDDHWLVSAAAGATEVASSREQSLHYPEMISDLARRFWMCVCSTALGIAFCVHGRKST